MLSLTPLAAHGHHPPLDSCFAPGEALVNTPVLPHLSPCSWEGIPEGLCLAAPSGSTWGLIPGPSGGTRGDSPTGRCLS